MRFLDNTWRGFAEEISISIILTVAFYLLMLLSGATEDHGIWDLTALAILAYVIIGGSMRFIRWAIAYKAPVFLYFLHFPAFIGIFIGAMILQNPGMWNLIGAISLFTLVGIYFIILIFLRSKGIMQRSPPGYRLDILKENMSIGERITLVFPDSYLKFLETGDKRFLRDEGDGERKE